MCQKLVFGNSSIIVLKRFPSNRVLSIMIFIKLLVLTETLKNYALAWIPDVRISGALFPSK